MLGTKSDVLLISRALAGSAGAWTGLVRRYERRIYNYALRMVGHPDDALDLAQEVFMAVHRNLATFRGESTFASWLFRIANYRCTDFLRARRILAPLDEAGELPSTAAYSDPAASAAAMSTNQRLTNAMQTLPPEQRVVVELKFFQHFTFEEIGGQLGISPN
ncbi:MAG: RNA polymerase sigma factor, partial [Pseudomonadales bacterium]